MKMNGNDRKVVYVTGCFGFIGSYVTRKCLQKGWYVKGVDKMTYAANRNLLNEFIEYENFSFVLLIKGRNFILSLFQPLQNKNF